MYKAYRRELDESRLHTAWTELIVGDRIDFACLDELAQEEVVRSVCQPGAAGIPSPIAFDNLDTSVTDANVCLIGKAYGLEHYGQTLMGIYRRLMDAPLGEINSIRTDDVLDAFLDPSRLRILRS